MKTLTFNDIENAINNSVDDIINNYNADTKRETILDAVFDETDSIFGKLIKQKLVTNYTFDDLIDTATDCTVILKYAKKFAWVENDTELWEGLWERLCFGMIASIAFFSLRNCFYTALENKGYDTNDDFPLANKKEVI